MAKKQMEQNAIIGNRVRDNKLAFLTGLLIIIPVALVLALYLAGWFITHYMIPMTLK